MNEYDYLIHYGVLGMKWGVRKDKKKSYRSTSPRAAIARAQNKKVDKSFEKWKENSNRKESAVALGKKANQSRLAYDKDKRNKIAKQQYKSDKKSYKKALRSNTTFRKGQIRSEVGKDMSRKYMSEAKKALQNGDRKTYQDFMSKHDIERAKARKASEVGAKRSNKKASAKRKTTVAVKTIAGTAALTAGTYAVNQVLSKNGRVSVRSSDVANAINILKKGKRILSYVY